MEVNINELKKMDRYKENLMVSDNNIFSYLTNVATIDHENREIIVPDWWSSTTSKHINYVAREYNYKVIKKY